MSTSEVHGAAPLAVRLVRSIWFRLGVVAILGVAVLPLVLPEGVVSALLLKVGWWLGVVAPASAVGAIVGWLTLSWRKWIVTTFALGAISVVGVLIYNAEMAQVDQELTDSNSWQDPQSLERTIDGSFKAPPTSDRETAALNTAYEAVYGTQRWQDIGGNSYLFEPKKLVNITSDSFALISEGRSSCSNCVGILRIDESFYPRPYGVAQPRHIHLDIDGDNMGFPPAWGILKSAKAMGPVLLGVQTDRDGYPRCNNFVYALSDDEIKTIPIRPSEDAQSCQGAP